MAENHVIEKLTDEQLAYMPVVRKKWVDEICNLYKSPIDYDRIYKGVCELYKLSDLSEPYVIFVASPTQAQFVANYCVHHKESPMDGDPKYKEAKYEFFDPDSKYVKKLPKKAVCDVSYGSYISVSDYSWIAFFDFFQQMPEPNLTYSAEAKAQYDNYLEFLRAGVFKSIQFNDCCIVCTTPRHEIKVDSELRPHTEYGATYTFDDGTKVYKWHGVEIPASIGEPRPEDVKIDDIFKLTNAEQRSAAINKIGMHRFVQETNYKVIEEKSALELYAEYPIGNYKQHGDVLLKPFIKVGGQNVEKIKRIEVSEVGEGTLRRIKNVNYKLIEVPIDLGGRAKEDCRYLLMDNPSINTHVHVEGVPNNINNIFGAICWRNKVNCLPMDIS